jgi:hypothetical protein
MWYRLPVMKSLIDTQLENAAVEAGLNGGRMPSLRDARRDFERHYILVVLE